MRPATSRLQYFSVQYKLSRIPWLVGAKIRYSTDRCWSEVLESTDMPLSEPQSVTRCTFVALKLELESPPTGVTEAGIPAAQSHESIPFQIARGITHCTVQYIVAGLETVSSLERAAKAESRGVWGCFRAVEFHCWRASPGGSPVPRSTGTATFEGRSACHELEFDHFGKMMLVPSPGQSWIMCSLYHRCTTP